MDPFDEIEKFIKDCQMQYNIVVETIQGTVKGALFEVCKRHPELKVCIMGCRRTDPYCGHLNEFQVSLSYVKQQIKWITECKRFLIGNRFWLATINTC